MRTAAAVAVALVLGCEAPEDAATSVSGRVSLAGEPVRGAVVRVQATELSTTTTADGSFTIDGLIPGEPQVVTASAPGTYIGGGDAHVPGDWVAIELEAHTQIDNPDYQFVPARDRAGGAGHCQRCHSEATEGVSLPYDEWVLDAHGSSAGNFRFLTLYAGTDVDGNQSPATRYAYSPDYGRIPLPPDPSQPYYGPGFRLDFPTSAGNCGACHLPAAAAHDPYGVDPLSVAGVDAEGITCDYCHKVWGVRLDDDTGLPRSETPGVLSTILLRPGPERQLFAGPLDDVAPGDDVYAPIYRDSRYCAPCHFGGFWNVQIYDSFGEWLASPYSDPDTGRSCQDCHMPEGLTDRFARAAAGGRVRTGIRSHRMLGASDAAFVAGAASMQLATDLDGARLRVRVTVTNDGAGHHFPTDSPLRQLILVVLAADAGGAPLEHIAGPTVPVWAGAGDPEDGAYAGLPGTGYAKILEQAWTGVTPTAAYWTLTSIERDNRLAAFESDTTELVFDAIGASSIDVSAKLVFRRADRALQLQKGWPDADIVVAEVSRTVEVAP